MALQYHCRHLHFIIVKFGMARLYCWRNFIVCWKLIFLLICCHLCSNYIYDCYYGSYFLYCSYPIIYSLYYYCYSAFSSSNPSIFYNTIPKPWSPKLKNFLFISVITQYLSNYYYYSWFTNSKLDKFWLISNITMVKL